MQATTSPGNHSTAPGLTCQPDQIPTALDVALAAAADGDYVGPCCWAADGACGCGRGHTGRDVGKAPLTAHGFLDFTRNEATIRAWWAQWPTANVGMDLARSGKAMVDPDSLEALDECVERGLPMAQPRMSFHPAFLFDRPADSPTVSVKRLGTDGHLDLLADGYALIYGTHRTGAPIYVAAQPRGPLPAWAVVILQQAAAQRECLPVQFSPDPNAATRGQALWPAVRAQLADRIVRTIEGGPSAYEPRPRTAAEEVAGWRKPDPSRSGADAAVVTALLRAGLDDDAIYQLYSAFPVGTAGKFAERGGVKYLARTIGKQRGWLGPFLAPAPAVVDPPPAPDPSPTLQDATGQIPPPDAEIARLRARIDQLEAELRECKRTGTEKVREARRETALVRRIHRNPHTRHIASTLLAATYHLHARQQIAADRARWDPTVPPLDPTQPQDLPCARLGDRAERSAGQVSRDLAAIEQRGLVVLAKRPLENGHQLMQAGVPALADGLLGALSVFARYAPAADEQLPQHGGDRRGRPPKLHPACKRHASIPACPDHPDERLDEQWRATCGVTACGRTLAEHLAIHPRLQDATGPAPAAPDPPLPTIPALRMDVGLQDATGSPLAHCPRCRRHALPNGQPSCTCTARAAPRETERYPVLEVAPAPSEWPTLDDEWAAFADALPDEEPLAVAPALPPPEVDPDWCPVHRRRLWAYADQQLGSCSTCADERAGAVPMAEVS